MVSSISDSGLCSRKCGGDGGRKKLMPRYLLISTEEISLSNIVSPVKPSFTVPAQRWLHRYVHSCYKIIVHLYIVLTPEDLENMGCHVAKFSSPLCIQHRVPDCRWCRATGGDGYYRHSKWTTTRHTLEQTGRYQPLNTPKQWPKSLEELEARQWSRQQTGENG